MIRLAPLVFSLIVSFLLVPLTAAAQPSPPAGLEPTAPANLRCPGLIDPGPPPGDPSQYELQWSWQWQTLIGNLGNLPTLRGLSLDASCNVYVANTSNNTVSEYSPSGKLLSQFGGNGNKTGQFAWAAFDGLTVDTAGNVLVGDPGRIQEFSAVSHQVMRVWASIPSQCASAGTSCQVMPNNGQVSGNFQLAVDGSGIVNAAAAASGVVRYAESGPMQTTWGPLTQGLSINGIGLDRTGNLYVTEGFAGAATHRISKVAPDGRLLLQVGGAKSQAPGRFASPTGIAIDLNGNIYVAEADNNRVQELSSTGEPLKMWADPGLFSNPMEITVDGRGEIFVDDQYNNRVQVYEAMPTWAATTPPPPPGPTTLQESPPTTLQNPPAPSSSDATDASSPDNPSAADNNLDDGSSGQCSLGPDSSDDGS